VTGIPVLFALALAWMAVVAGISAKNSIKTRPHRRRTGFQHIDRSNQIFTDRYISGDFNAFNNFFNILLLTTCNQLY